MGTQRGTRSQLRHSTSMNVGGRTKPMVSADYVVGLTDGEGCFYALIKSPFNNHGGAIVQLQFFIKVQARDRPVLDKVRQRIGCGAVYFQAETRANHAQCYRYTVNSHRDIVGVIIPFFRAHPLQSPSKKKSFEIFLPNCKISGAGQASLKRRD